MSNQELAIEKKNLGNAALQQQDYPTAIGHYTEGINLDPTNHILFSNRSAAYHNSNMFQEALEDAESVIKLNPQFWKGYSRKGLALLSLGKGMEALEAYQEGLKIAPGEQALVSGVEAAQQLLYQEQQNSQNVIVNMMMSQFQGDVVAKARSYPECAHFAESADFKKKVAEIQANPQKLMEYLQDEQISTYVSAGIQKSAPREMGMTEEEMAKRRMEEREHQLRREEEERLRKKAHAQKRKEEEAKKKEEERLAAMTPEQIQAEAIKKEANELYKQKSFDAAIQKYNEALELDPTNMVYLSNIGAVYFSQKQFDKSIEACEQALEVGYANFGDLTLKARALARIGNCYFQKGEYEEAIEYYKKSLLEESDRKVSQQLRKSEKALLQKKKEDYINPELSEKAREEGNDFFRGQNYPEAVKCYTEAIKRNPTNPIPYSNRATAFTKLGAYREAIKDCDQAISLDPTFIKAYLKKGHAYFVMEDFSQCLSTYDEALKYDPDNSEVQTAIQTTVYKINSTSRDEKTVQQNIQNNPELQEILRDPMMKQVLNDLQTDRAAAAAHMADPVIRSKIDKLIAAGVIQ